MFWGSAAFSKILYAILLLLILIVFQSLFSEVVAIKGIRLDLALLILVYIGLTRGPTQGAVFGFLIGILLDVFAPQRLGLGAVIKSLIGFTIGNLKGNLFLGSSYSKGAIVFLSVILNDLFYHLFSEGITLFTFHTILYHSLPSALYTCVAGVILFAVLEKKGFLEFDLTWKD